jgi:hypothetical protein
MATGGCIMELRRTARKIDPELLAQAGGILDGILEKLGVPCVHHVARSDERFERAIDSEIANLSGGLFGEVSAMEIPLEAFHLDELGEPLPVSRPRIDSFAPIAHPILPPGPEHGRARRPVPWILGYAMAAGVAGLVATGALVRTTPATQPAAAPVLAATAPVLAATAPEAVVPAQDPAPSAEAAPLPITPHLPNAPHLPAGPLSAPRAAAARPPAAVAPLTAKAPSPEPDTADLPLVIPPLPPKPQVAFNRAAAAVAIAGGGLRAASCRKDGAGSTGVPVSVTFAPSGSVVGARVTGGALLGTAEGGCVAAALRGAHVPAFDGEPVAVGTVVTLP